MFNNRLSALVGTQGANQTDQAFIRLLYLVLSKRDIAKENVIGYKRTLEFFRNHLVFNRCPTLTDNVRRYWLGQIDITMSSF